MQCPSKKTILKYLSSWPSKTPIHNCKYNHSKDHKTQIFRIPLKKYKVQVGDSMKVGKGATATTNAASFKFFCDDNLFEPAGHDQVSKNNLNFENLLRESTTSSMAKTLSSRGSNLVDSFRKLNTKIWEIHFIRSLS